MTTQEKRAHIARLVETARTLRKIGSTVAAEAMFANAKRMHAAIRAAA